MEKLRKDFAIITGETLSLIWKMLWYIPTPLIIVVSLASMVSYYRFTKLLYDGNLNFTVVYIYC